MMHRRLSSPVALALGVVLLALTVMSCNPSQTGSIDQDQDQGDNGKVAQAWAVQYQGLDDYRSGASCIAVDPDGNVVVTGESNGDCVTIKYAPDGKEIWVARYNGPDGLADQARAVVIDDAGNVYVIDISQGSSTSHDYVTIKYDEEGHELWVARYDGAFHGLDYTAAMALDSAGNVYVTGSSAVGDFDWDYATVKYDPNGRELWVACHSSPQRSIDAATDVAVDEQGSVYVTGHVTEGDRATTIEYDTDGNQQWVASYTGQASAIALCPDGGVCVTGDVSRDGVREDYSTTKYDSDGNQLWVARYCYAPDSRNWSYAVAVDQAGNVYVTGQAEQEHLEWYRSVTVKYDRDGSQLWVAEYNGNGASALALDATGNVYVTGPKLDDMTGADYATVKYDANGNEMWEISYGDPGRAHDSPQAIALDGSDNVYVTGFSGGEYQSYCYYTTVKYIRQ